LHVGSSEDSKFGLHDCFGSVKVLPLLFTQWNELLGNFLIVRLLKALNLDILNGAQDWANQCCEKEKPDNLLLVFVKRASWYKLRSYHLGIPRDLLTHWSIFRLESLLVILPHDFDKVPGPNCINVFFHL
jgi:hypothetical protein